MIMSTRYRHVMTPNGPKIMIPGSEEICADPDWLTLFPKGSVVFCGKSHEALSFLRAKWGVELATTGDDAYAATTGDDAHAATTGYAAHAATTGNAAIAAALGGKGHVKAGLKGAFTIYPGGVKNGKLVEAVI